MAYRRTLTLTTTTSKFFTLPRSTPSISHLPHHQNDDPNPNPNPRSYTTTPFTNTPSRFSSGGGLGFQDRRWSSQLLYQGPMGGFGFMMLGGRNNMSTGVGGGVGGGGGIEKVEYMYDMGDVLGEKGGEVVSEAVASHGEVVSEVAVAAADSWLPVAGLQYAIDGVHNFVGVNWWASIVITTLCIRTLMIPIMINQLKATSKLTILRPELEAIKQEMQDRGMSPSAVTEGQDKIKRVFAQHGVSTFTPLKGLLFQGPVFVSFFLAIQNMVDKVPSFKTGGMSWFLDLTTADPFYMLPCLTAFSFWITVEFNMQEGLEGNPAAKTMKNVSRAFAALTIPLTASFPKALFCYWITSNLFSLVYGAIIKKPSVKKLLNIPIIVPPPPAAGDAKPGISFFESLKAYAKAQALQKYQEKHANSTTINQSVTPLISNKKPTSEDQKSSNQREAQSSVLSQRIKRLEKEVKGRKKKQKR